MRVQDGFTLLELMIVVAVIAILTMIALPSYQEHVRKGKRAEAAQAIGELHLRQERWRAEHPSYGNTTGATAALNNLFGSVAAVAAYNSSLKNYTISASGDAVSYSITATRKGSMAGDTRCGNFTLSFANGVVTKTKSGTETVDYCWRQ